MLFNLDKCKVMHFRCNNPHVGYFMDAIQIQEVHEEKDLGVIVSDDLKWDKQCVAVVKNNNNDRLTAFHPRLPGWAGNRRNINHSHPS